MCTCWTGDQSYVAFLACCSIFRATSRTHSMHIIQWKACTCYHWGAVLPSQPTTFVMVYTSWNK